MLRVHRAVVYRICVDSSGWYYVGEFITNEKDKKGLYCITRHNGFDSYDEEVSVEAEFLFIEEDKTWWRNAQDATRAFKLFLKKLYDSGKLPKNATGYYSEQEEDDYHYEEQF